MPGLKELKRLLLGPFALFLLASDAFNSRMLQIRSKPLYSRGEIEAELMSMFSVDEASKVLSFLEHGAPRKPKQLWTQDKVDTIRSRINQAKYILGSQWCRREEASTIRDSFLLQPSYFTQSTEVVFENEGVCVVEKPFDTQVQSRLDGRFTGERKLLDILRISHHRNETFLRPCHNLDFATSGLLVLAKSKHHLSLGSLAFDHLRADHSDGHFEKEYRALVLGWVCPDLRDGDSFWVHSPISADLGSEFKMTCPDLAGTSERVVDLEVANRWGPSRLPPAVQWTRDSRSQSPRDASTKIEVLQRGTFALAGPLFGKPVTLLKLAPTTGRRHQLRVHLAALGHPILGDVAYAGDISTYRLMLHAHSITFKQPQCSKMEVAAEEDEEGVVEVASTGRRARARRKKSQLNTQPGLQDSFFKHGHKVTSGIDPFMEALVT